MRVLRENLLLIFSVAGFVIILAVGLALVLTVASKLENEIDLLKDLDAAILSGTTIKSGDPYSIASLIDNMIELKWTTYIATGVGFLILYLSLIGIVWRRSRERGELVSAQARLETTVAERVEELRESNFRLQSEIEERRSAETALGQTNLRLEETLEELRETQQQMTQQERMQAMGQMASGVAHDFNNALMPILGNADLLLEFPDVLDDKEELIECLQTIRTSARDASNVVTRLREFYRTADTHVTEAADLNQLIESSISLTQARWKVQAQADGITINIETELEDLPSVAINGSDLREALTNLIMNAADAMPESGTITFRTRTEGEMVALEVSDTGTGMTEEVRQRCMDPFFTTKGERGSGLGLAMVYGIIQRNRGTIDVASELGKGTRFTIRLPPGTAAETEFELPESTKPPSILHILAVDDDQEAQRTLARLMRAMGHSIDLATDGHQALAMFRSGKYDLVVTDRAMPDMNGDQLAAAIKDLVPDQLVIMLTGFGEIMSSTGENPPGVDLVMSKPITLADLRDALLKLGA